MDKTALDYVPMAPGKTRRNELVTHSACQHTTTSRPARLTRKTNPDDTSLCKSRARCGVDEQHPQQPVKCLLRGHGSHLNVVEAPFAKQFNLRSDRHDCDLSSSNRLLCKLGCFRYWQGMAAYDPFQPPTIIQGSRVRTREQSNPLSATSQAAVWTKWRRRRALRAP
jgi:hypothetical protein